MSFSFDFSGDDIEHESDSAEELTTRLEDTNLDTKLELRTPQTHSLTELFETLPSQISYNSLVIRGAHNQESQSTDVSVPRRSLFDIRQQLMAEADVSDDNDTNHVLLSGLDKGDLKSSVYEGGFKTWECSLDLAAFLLQKIEALEIGRDIHIIELGAGSAIPSLTLLQHFLKQRDPKRHVTFTICDYNEPVLRLCTCANVLLTTLLNTTAGIPRDGDRVDDEELEVDQTMLCSCIQNLSDANVTVDFISGAWSEEFSQLLRERRSNSTKEQLLVLASETIYEPETLLAFSQTMLNILRVYRGHPSQAYVAAKKMYFGVGGGVREFGDTLGRLGGSIALVNDIKGAGVGRAIWQVKLDQD